MEKLTFSTCTGCHKSETLRFTIQPVGKIPDWLVGLSLVGGVCVLTLAVTKWLKWW